MLTVESINSSDKFSRGKRKNESTVTGFSGGYPMLSSIGVCFCPEALPRGQGWWKLLQALHWPDWGASYGNAGSTECDLLIFDHIWSYLAIATSLWPWEKRSKCGDGCGWSSSHRSTGGLALGSGTAGGASEPGTVLRNPLSVPWS